METAAAPYLRLRVSSIDLRRGRRKRHRIASQTCHRRKGRAFPALSHRSLRARSLGFSPAAAPAKPALWPLPPSRGVFGFLGKMHPPLTLHRHPMCADIIEEFQKCHTDYPIGKFFGKCTELKIKLDRCFRQEKALKRKANFEESKKFRERLQAYRKEMSENAKNEPQTC